MIMQESEELEFKKSTAEIKEAMISIVAILNKHTKGTLYFGIKNDGKAIGQQVTPSTLREISQTIANSIEPKIFPQIKTETIDGQSCIKITFEGHEQPYYARGRPYIRVADEDRQLSAKERENIILRKTAAKWDSKGSTASLDEIEEKTLKEFVQKANQSQRIQFMYTNKKDVLTKLGLIKDAHLTNAAVLLFSKKEPIEVQAAVFAGTNKTTFLDIRQFKGNLFQVLQQSESYIKEHINWKAALNERTRKEIPEIPLRALTEALVNSFCHRDYQAPESNKIAIYKDRIEIWNPGTFPEGYTPQDFMTHDLPSILRNPSIANTLYLCSEIEKWGSGLKRISEECALEHVPVEFNILTYGFAVQFVRTGTAQYTPGGQKSGQKSGQITTRQKDILRLIAQKPTISREELAEKIGINQSAIQKHLTKLKEEGQLKRIGPDKGGYWEVKRP